MSTLRKIIRNSNDLDDLEYQKFLNRVVYDKQNKMELIAYISAVSAKSMNDMDIRNFTQFVHHITPKKSLKCSQEVINIVGTGGGISTFNVSTCAAFVAAAAGIKVLKSGSYSYNSNCGSLDLLEALGIHLPENEVDLEDMIDETGIGFVNPTMYSSILRRIAVTIYPLNLRDIGGFINKIGPLLSPFKVHGQVCGVSSIDLVPVFAKALYENGITNSISVSAAIGMDEFSAIGINIVSASAESPHCINFDPINVGMHHGNQDGLIGIDPGGNASKLISVLQGKSDKLSIDTVVLNAAHAIKLVRKNDSILNCILRARQAIECGAADRLFKRVCTRKQITSLSV